MTWGLSHRSKWKSVGIITALCISEPLSCARNCPKLFPCISCPQASHDINTTIWAHFTIQDTEGIGDFLSQDHIVTSKWQAQTGVGLAHNGWEQNLRTVCKELDGKRFDLYRPFGLCSNYSSSAMLQESSHKHCIYKACLHANKTLFMKPGDTPGLALLWLSLSGTVCAICPPSLQSHFSHLKS